MANKAYAEEWLSFAAKELETAALLLDAGHYTDIIGITLQQTLEKSLKALFAAANIKIPRDHDLVRIAYLLEDRIDFEENEIMLLRIASDYYKAERYPNPNYFLPAEEEIREIFDFSLSVYIRCCETAGIKIDRDNVPTLKTSTNSKGIS